MKRLLALALVIGAVVWARALGQATPSGSAGTALALGFTLLGAWIAGDLLRRLHLPRLTGYLLFGVLVGPYLGNLITAAMAGQLQVITGIATSLIALIAGLTLNLERLGRQFAVILRLTGVVLGCAILGIGAALWLAWPWLPIAPEATGLPRLAMVLLMAVIAVTFSPTMAAAVTTETGARGPLSELVLPVVVLADLVLLLLFSLAMQFARGVLEPGTQDNVTTLVRFAWEIGGAVAFGCLVGACFALYLRYVGREVSLVLIAVCTLLSHVGTQQQFEPLLAAVAAGLVIENLSIAQGDALKTAVQRGATPVLVIFFVAVGTSLRLDTLAVVGFAALALSLLRIAVLKLGIRVGTAFSGADPATSRYLWTGLVSQVGGWSVPHFQFTARLTAATASITWRAWPGSFREPGCRP